MKKINNNCVEVLPSLLNKTKKQTIRKAWIGKYETIKPILGNELSINYNKAAKFEVGEIVEVWYDYDGGGNNPCYAKCVSGKYSAYNYLIGNVRISHVYKIKIHKQKNTELYAIFEGLNQLSKLEVEAIAFNDGFKSSQEMFKYFDDNYDLTSAKQFWVYEWEWVEK